MMTLLGSLLGFGTSFLPEILNYFKASQDHKHKLERMKVEMDMMTKRNELKLNIIDKQAEIKETEGLYKHDSMDSGGFVNALRGSVRPVITYCFFALFVAVQTVVILRVMAEGGNWTDAVPLMWTAETQGLFAAIMSFWFGNRAVSKYYGVKK
jgi:hypothetical protein